MPIPATARLMLAELRPLAAKFAIKAANVVGEAGKASVVSP